VDNGKLISQFHKAHGSAPITSICLDRENRRLFTGSHKGDMIKTWNFNNGSLLKVFTKVRCVVQRVRRAIHVGNGLAARPSCPSSHAKCP